MYFELRLDISSKEEELLVINFSVFYYVSEKQTVVCNSGNLMLVAGSLQVEICNSGLQLPA